MPFAIVTQTMGANEEVTFDFSSFCTGGNTIQQIVYGISQLRLQQTTVYCAGNGGNTKNFEISLTKPSNGGGVGTTSLTLLSKITLQDWGVLTDCSLIVTVLAYIGSTTGVLLANQTGIKGISGSPQGISNVPEVCTGILSGFSFTSDDSSALLGFGVSAGTALALGNPPTKPFVLPMGSGICHVTNQKPMTTTVDVGSIIFTAAQSEVVVGTIVDCMSFNPSFRSAGHKITSPALPALSAIAVFLQSFALQFPISSSFHPTPGLNSVLIGSSDANPNSNGFTFTSSQNLCTVNTSTIPSHTATYLYVGVVATG